MNDKQQLAAMGEHLSEHPMCLAKRVEELEAQCAVMADSLRYQREFVTTSVWDDKERSLLLENIDTALAGKLPEPVAPEGWQLVPVEPTHDMLYVVVNCGHFDVVQPEMAGKYYRAMLSAAPAPEAK